ncbi:neurogenic locus Notch protein-like isoform X3 [Dreissena polymorpha]|uniref:neurogenic locus Notch protein-like isoform X3 n=1 Tax=Dreissena polymorpha TaxID=45954 RepID=UPI0022655DEB|nr:neurogenic locus Notch protein-like isoform X3 [Dreissena polymorpha]
MNLVLVVGLFLCLESASTTATQCLSCAPMVSSAQCATTKTCLDGQECYAKYVLKQNGTVIFEFGCHDFQTCPDQIPKVTAGTHVIIGKRATGETELCYKCCHGDLCNQETLCTGMTTTTPVSPCSPSPCLRGSCFIGSGNNPTFFCLCPSGFTGLHCETEINPCSPSPCVHGSCFKGSGNSPTFFCLCPSQFTGLHCETVITTTTAISTTTPSQTATTTTTTATTTPVNPCNSSPCVHGTCFIGSGNSPSFFCLCPSGFTGLQCETIFRSTSSTTTQTTPTSAIMTRASATTSLKTTPTSGAAGQFVTLDGYCQQTYNNNSYLCRKQYRTGYEYACASLYCYDDGQLFEKCMFSIPPPDGTLCGNGKWCNAHSCSVNRNARVTSDACPLGDSENPDVLMGKNCQELFAMRPSLCLLPEVGNTWCCESCAAFNRSTPDSFFGPTLSADDDCKSIFGLKSYFCQTDSNYGNRDYSGICLSMRCFNPTKLTCDPFPAGDGVPCASGKWCVSGRCVNSSLASVDPVADCLYGDQYEAFCRANVVYPNIGKYCSQYEAGCCASCLRHKNSSFSGCEYGDATPVECQAKKKDGSIKTTCLNDPANCCDTCAHLSSTGNPDCPYGDVNVATCNALMNDTNGPGNCYSQSRRTECCDSCAEYYNATHHGCEYGDHWKDYCAENVVPPNVATVCGKYADQCCETCRNYRDQGFPGCQYGDIDPARCKAYMADDKGTANCYNTAIRSMCCLTCHKIEDKNARGCVYGDSKPRECESQFNDTLGYGHCYNLQTQIDCCRSCEQAKNKSMNGCEWGDKDFAFCSSLTSETAFLCFQQSDACCETCQQYVVSNNAECRYGDKSPANCQLFIPNEEAARTQCQIRGLDCCATCSRLGHPGPGGHVLSSGSASMLG